MGILVKLAWRNIFRNKRRTFITGIAIGIGMSSLVFVDALYIGMEENMVHNATASFLGEGQIHRRGFRETLDVEKTINDLDDVTSRLRREEIVKNFSLRTMAFAMISSPANIDAVSMVGIDPQFERHISQVDEAIVAGTYFEEDGERDLLIGRELADVLEVGLGDRVVLTTAEAHTGDLAQEMFRVSGIYHFNIKELDRALAFVRLDKAQSMLNVPGQAHEIVIQFKGADYGRSPESPFWASYSTGGNEAVGWTVLLPQIEAVFELSDFGKLVTGIILFSVVALGIINTLFMSIHERMFEFGIIRAVGTRRTAVAGLVVLEAAALAIVSIGIGTIIAFALTFAISRVGIDYTGIEFAGVTFRERLYPVLNVKQFVYYPAWVFALTTLIGLYPATHAARLVPARAMRKSF